MVLDRCSFSNEMMVQYGAILQVLVSQTSSMLVGQCLRLKHGSSMVPACQCLNFAAGLLELLDTS